MRDNTGEVLSRRRTRDMLKVIEVGSLVIPTGGERVKLADGRESYEVEKVLDARKVANQYEYLVKWKGYDESDNSWVKANDFDDIKIIHKFWKEREKKGGGISSVGNLSVAQMVKRELRPRMAVAKKNEVVGMKMKKDVAVGKKRTVKKK